MGMSNKTEAEIVTVSRASTKWVFDATGSLVEVPVDQLAHDYDPATGEYRGVLVEGERTNELAYSNTSSMAIGRAVRGASESKSFGVDGFLYSDNGEGQPNINKSNALTGDGVKTASVFVDATNSDSFEINMGSSGNSSYGGRATFTPSSQTWSGSGFDSKYASDVDYGAQHIGGNLWRIWLSVTFIDIGSGAFPVFYFGTGNTDVWMGGVQLEEGSSPTSYIPTAGAPVTRTADDISRLFNAEYNSQQGTWVADIDAVDANLLRGIGLDGLRLTGKGTLVYRYDESGGAVFINGVKAFDTPPISRPELLTLGDDRGSVHIRDVRYRPYAFTDGEAQAAAVGAIGVDYPFEDGQSLSLGFDVQDYGKRAHQDSLDALRTSDAKNLLSVTRATPKWVFDGTGTLVEVPVDQPAYDHDPVTGEALGVLIEPGATNLLTHSIPHEGAWVISQPGDATGPQAIEDAGESFLGTGSNFSRITKGDEYYFQGPVFNYSAGDVLTYSVFIVIESASSCLLELSNTSNWVASSFMANPGEGVAVGGGVERFDFQFEAAVDGSSAVRLKPYGVAGDTLMVGGVQLEEGTYPTSYIPTAGSAVTRAADNVSRSLGAEFNEQMGTFSMDFAIKGRSGGTAYVLSGGVDNRFFYFPGSSDTYLGSYDGESALTLSGLEIGSLNKAAIAWQPDTRVVSLNGASVSGGHNGSIGQVSYVGVPGVSPLQPIYIKRLDYYPYAMTAQELESLTTP